MTKILIIEDEPLLREAYEHILRFAGYTVAVASDGIEGISRLQSFKPKLILLDVLMPRLDGIGFLKQSQVRKKYPDIKIIACTNLSDQVTVDQMIHHGADCQVLKSDLSPKQLVSLVDNLLNV